MLTTLTIYCLPQYADYCPVLTTFMLYAHCFYDFMLLHLNLPRAEVNQSWDQPKWLIYRSGQLTDSQIITNKTVN